MELFLGALAIVSHAGLVMTGVCGAALAIGMPALLIVGLVDGPTGGRLAAVAEKGAGRQRTPRASGALHVAPTPERQTA